MLNINDSPRVLKKEDFVSIVAKVLVDKEKLLAQKNLSIHGKDFESTQVKIEKETCRMNCANMCLMVIFITKT